MNTLSSTLYFNTGYRYYYDVKLVISDVELLELLTSGFLNIMDTGWIFRSYMMKLVSEV